VKHMGRQTLDTFAWFHAIDQRDMGLLTEMLGDMHHLKPSKGFSEHS